MLISIEIVPAGACGGHTVRDKAAEVPTHDAVPGRALPLIELLHRSESTTMGVDWS